LIELKESASLGKAPNFYIIVNGLVRYEDSVCAPYYEELKRDILEEVNKNPYTVHLGSMKMYRDIKNRFWGANMKREIMKYLSQCSTCQEAKAKHQWMGGLLKPIHVPKWK
jgi:hypothetical protein